MYVIYNLLKVKEQHVTKQPKPRSDLMFQESNLPKPVEFDYSKDITDKHFDLMNKAMMHRSDLSKEELEEALAEGILVGGEIW